MANSNQSDQNPFNQNTSEQQNNPFNETNGNNQQQQSGDGNGSSMKPWLFGCGGCLVIFIILF